MSQPHPILTLTTSAKIDKTAVQWTRVFINLSMYEACMETVSWEDYWNSRCMIGCDSAELSLFFSILYPPSGSGNASCSGYDPTARHL